MTLEDLRRLTPDQKKLMVQYAEETQQLNKEIETNLAFIKAKRRRINEINRKAMGILNASRITIKTAT